MDLKNLLLSIGSLCLSLIILELGLRLFTVFPIHNPLANTIPDDKLGYIMDPCLEDIDNNGFRNDKLFEHADIVALGDSHTFGWNVPSESSWPQQLADMTNKTVYNFGVGGYGSLQYHNLIDEAIKLGPDYITLGLYLANDLNDTCNLIRQIAFWQQWAKESGYNVGLCLTSKRENFDDEPKVIKLIKSNLKKIAIGSLIAHVRNRVFARLAISNKEVTDNKDLVVNQGMNKTIIRHAVISRHARYMDISQGDISLGFEITKNILSGAKKKADLNNIKFIVIFIPSKENVFFDYLMMEGYRLPEDYYRLVDNERTLVDSFSSFFKQKEIKFVDARPYVLRKLNEAGNVYLSSADGHPLEIGYRAYAEAVYDSIFAED